MAHLKDMIDFKEKKEQEKKKTSDSHLRTASTKKGVYFKINEDTYAKFQEINRAKNITNNGSINLLITQYIKDNEDWIS